VTTPQQSVPLSAPYYGASIGTAFSRFWTKYATFSGRASRSEYWWWMLIDLVIWIVLGILARLGGAGVTDASGAMTGPNGLGIVVSIVIVLFALATIVPSLALTVRRLHDANLSGFFTFLSLVPFVGGIIILVMTLLPSHPQGQRFDGVS
jgi:uncharacterized membrane protein YhaH (DUF805 family)